MLSMPKQWKCCNIGVVVAMFLLWRDKVFCRTAPPPDSMTLCPHASQSRCQWIYLGHDLECCEKTKSFNLKIPQPDSERRHSPDFRTVFEIMIGPFSFCEIGKTWGTNKQVNKQTNKNWNFQFPQPDYRPRHSPDLRTGGEGWQGSKRP